MDATILVFLLQDGVTNGLIYVLLAVATIVTFSATRITFIPQGDFVALGALTLASLAAGKVPGTARLVMVLSVLAVLMEIHAGLRRRRGRIALRAGVAALPGLVALAIAALPSRGLPYGVAIVLMLVLVVPIGPLLYRVVYQPLADASVLVLLIVSAAVHYVLAGLTLYFFGPEGVRIPPAHRRRFRLGRHPRQRAGRSDPSGDGGSPPRADVLLRTHAARQGAARRRLEPHRQRTRRDQRAARRHAGAGAFRVDRALSGVLIGPVVTMFYDTGFGIGLRGFVGAIFGGLTNYPLAALGSLFIGLVESFAAFYASQYKETIVFLLVIPVLVVLSLRHRAVED